MKDQLAKTMKQMPDFEKLKNNIDMTVTNEGLRIELTESANGTFFDSGSSKLNDDGIEILIALARNSANSPTRSPSKVTPTPSPTPPHRTYSNWELSSDRANAARRLMLANGIRTRSGHPGPRLRRPAPAQKRAPLDPSNRRISLIVQYLLKNNDDEDAKPASGEQKPTRPSLPRKTKSSHPAGNKTPDKSAV